MASENPVPSTEEFPVEQQNGNGSMVITMSPPRANKKRTQSVMPPKLSEPRVVAKRRTTEQVARINKENSTTTNGALSSQTETPGETLTRIREEMSTAHRKKLSLLRMVDTESKTARVASNRAHQLEEKLNTMAAEKSKVDSRRTELEKEVSELRKKATTLEQRIGRLGTRAETFQMKKELANLQFVQSVEFEHVASQKKGLEMTKAQIAEKLYTRERQLAELKGSYVEMEQGLLMEKKQLEGEIASINSQLSNAQLSLSQEKGKTSGLDIQITSTSERIARLTLEKQSKEAELSHTIQLLEDQLSQSISRWDATSKELSQTKTMLEATLLTLADVERNALKFEEDVAALDPLVSASQESWRSDAAQLESRFSALDDAVSVLQLQNDQLVDALGKVRERNGTLSADLAGNQQRLVALQKSFDELSNQRSRLALQHEMMQTELNGASSRLNTERGTTGTLSAQLEEARRENAELASAVADLQNSLSELSLKAQDAAMELEQERAAAELVQRERDSVLEDREQSEESIVAYIEQVSALEQDILDMKAEIESVREQAATEQARLQEAIESGEEGATALKAEKDNFLLDVEQLHVELEGKVDELSALATEATEVTACYDEAVERIEALEQEHNEFVQAAQAQIVESRADFQRQIEVLKETMDGLTEQIKQWIAKDKAALEQHQLMTQRIASAEQGFADQLRAAGAQKETLEKDHARRMGELAEQTAQLNAQIGDAQATKSATASEARVLAAKLEGADERAVKLAAEVHELHESITALTSKIGEQDAAIAESMRKEAANEQALESWQERTRYQEDSRKEAEQRLNKAEEKYEDTQRSLVAATKGEHETRVTLNETRAYLEEELASRTATYKGEIATKEALSAELASTRTRLNELEQQLTACRTEHAALRAKSSDEISRLTKALEQKSALADQLTNEMNAESEKRSEVKLELTAAQERLTALRETESKLREKVRELKEETVRDKDALAALRSELASAKGEATQQRRQLQSTREQCEALASQLSKASEEEKIARVDMARLQERDTANVSEIDALKSKVEALAQKKQELKAALSSAQEGVAARQEAVKGLEANLEVVVAEQAALTQEREERVAAIAQIQEAMSELTNQLQAMAQFHEATVAELGETRSKVDESAKEHAELTEALAKAGAELEETQVACEEEQMAAAETESQRDQVQRDVDQTRETLAQVTEELTALSAQLKKAQRLTTSLEATFATKTSAVAEKAGALRSAEFALVGASTLSDFSEMDVIAMRSEIAQVEAALKGVRAQWLDAQSQLTQSEEQRHSALNELKSARQQLTQAKLQASQAHRDVTERDEELRVRSGQHILLESHLNKALAQGDESVKHLKELAQQEATTSDAIAKVKAELTKMFAAAEEEAQLTEKALDGKATAEATLAQREEAWTKLAAKWETTIEQIATLSDAQEQHYAKAEALNAQHEFKTEEAALASARLATVQGDLAETQRAIKAHEATQASLLTRAAELEGTLHTFSDKHVSHVQAAERALEHGRVKQAALRVEHEASKDALRQEMAMAADKAQLEIVGQQARLAALTEQLRAAEGELAALAEQKRLEEAEKEAALAANTVDARRTHAQVSHELSITRREMQRLKDALRLRDAKFDEYKARTEQTQVADLSNQVLREQAQTREQEVRRLTEELRKLKAAMTKSSTATNDAKQQTIELQKRERLLQEYETKAATLEALSGARDAEMEELRAAISNPALDKSQGKNEFEQMKRDVAQLKKEKLELQGLMARLKQAQLKATSGSQIRPDQQ